MGRIIRSVVGVVAGMAIAIALIIFFEAISGFMFPPPEGTNMADLKQMEEYIAKLPTVALVLYLVYHSIATFCGAFVGSTLAGRSYLTHALIVGALPLVGAIFNLMYIPHPT
jgi:predicted MFS family arabinose efflux permease